MYGYVTICPRGPRCWQRRILPIFTQSNTLVWHGAVHSAVPGVTSGTIYWYNVRPCGDSQPSFRANQGLALTGQIFVLQMQDKQLTSRAVRSFVVRNGRMTASQSKALDTLMPIYGIDYQDQTLDVAATFGRTAPLWVETGFGDGEALLAIAGQNPDINFLGIEVHAPGVGHLLTRIESQGLGNIKVIRHDAVEVFGAMLPPASVERALLLFPDPWPKKKHHKRRILQLEFVELVESRLQTGGVLHCATDWAEYADEMLDLLSTRENLKNLDADTGFSPRPPYRPETKFERRGLRLGHQVFDLLYQRV